MNAFHPDYVKTYMPEFLSSIKAEEKQKQNGIDSATKARASRESVNSRSSINMFPKTKARVSLERTDFHIFQKAGMPKGKK